MNSLWCLIIILSSSSAFAGPVVSLEILTSHADRFSYRDNRDTLSKDKTFSASKGCCGAGPYSVIEAYPGRAGFQQVALWCDHCDPKGTSFEQLKLCKDEFGLLYKSLVGEEFSKDMALKMDTLGSGKTVTISALKHRIRFSTGKLKCDGASGSRVRIDFFAR